MTFQPVTAVLPNGLYLDGARADARIDGRVMGARLVRAYDAATSFELTLFDDDFAILAGGLLARRGHPHGPVDRDGWARFGQAQIPLDGIMFRLAGIEGAFGENGHTLTVTLEDEVAALMRRHKGALKQTRDRNTTRAEFIGLMAHEVKETRIAYRSPEQGIKQRVKDDKAKQKADKERDRGLSGRDVTIKGVRATKQQRKNLEVALGVADDEQAGELATLAMLVAGIGESSFTAVPNSQGSNYWGVFQGSKDVFAIGDTEGMARSFLLGGKGFQAGGAKKLAAEQPDYTPGTIAYKVEGDRANFNSDSAAAGFYDVWQAEAQAILDAYGGVGTLRVRRRKFQFKREKGETSWAASDRLAEEVRWRRFADRNVLWYVSDEWLSQRQPRFLVQRGKLANLIVVHDEIAHTVLGIENYSADVGKPVAELTFRCMLNDRWAGAPGAVVELAELGPLDGRWLIASNDLDLFSGESSITIRRPAPKLPEPAADTDISLLTESDPAAGTARQRIVAAAKKAYKLRAYYRYDMIRPMPDSLYPGDKFLHKSAVPIPREKVIDCSAFVTLVYKAAAVPDPNNLGYNGTGNTSTLRANGKRTNDPQPGDLVHFGSGAPGGSSHVNVYIGNGECMNMGSQGLTKLKLADVKAWSSPRFAGIYTYDLGE